MVVGAEFQGRAAPLEAGADSYVVITCAQMEAGSGCGECAEVWCDSDESSDCVLRARHVIRVADTCADCERGDLLVSRNALAGLSLANVSWIPIKWRCTACDTSSGGAGNGAVEFLADEQTLCPGYVGGMAISSFESSGGVNSAQSTNDKGSIGSSGEVSYNDIDYSASLDGASGSSGSQIEVPDTSNINSGSGSASSSNGNTASWPSSGSTSIRPWKEPGAKTAPPMHDTTSKQTSAPSPTALPASGDSSSSLSSVTISLVPPSDAPGEASTASQTSDPSSSDYSPSIIAPEPTTAQNGSTSHPVGAVASPDDDVQDRAAADTSSPALPASTSAPGKTGKTNSPTAATAIPSPTPGRSDISSSDGNLSATSAVTKSPFFYASIVLAIAGLVGVIVGYRAKRKRSHRNELRAYQMSMRQSTRTATPISTLRLAPTSPANLATRVHFDDHIAIL
ncbi:unnamed protein product [Phytophthora lilii]|uniref:Unnamed protein product n=1 Tax=Phytophthora lilii TaxID=2077276 RepID=A0A9W6TD72_9STRA|nr:unnamed protein product [Phytophthora lilii]